MSHRGLRIAIGLVSGVIVVIVVIEVVDRYNDPDRVAYMLNIPTPPSSLQVFECESGPPTDIVITCAIEIDPQDFPLLLTGYSFSESSVEGTSHSVALEKVGPDFPVNVEYIVRPKEFRHGGSVTVLADPERRRALVDLYIE